MEKAYRKTAYACYAADMIQAVVINVTPILFVYLKAAYGLSYSQFGTLVVVNFGTQVAVDLLLGKTVDRYGYRPFVVGAHIICTVGFILFGLTPWLMPGREFVGFLAGTVLFSGAGGLFELLLSPIVDALPSENKAKEMSLLHSMYAWGKLGCILLTTAALFLGVPWYGIILFCAVLPACNAVAFLRVPLLQKVAKAEIMPSRKMIFSPTFGLAFLAISFGGAAEVTMSQWSSMIMQDGLGLPKVVGDLMGAGGFSFMLGFGRMLHGLYGEKIRLSTLLVFGSLLAAGGYLLVGIAPTPWVGALACAMTGFFVSIAWPGTLSIAAECLPKAGTSLFALLAAAGDIGGSLGPWMMGTLVDKKIAMGFGGAASLKYSVLVATLFPLVAALFQWLVGRAQKQGKEG